MRLELGTATIQHHGNVEPKSGFEEARGKIENGGDVTKFEKISTPREGTTTGLCAMCVLWIIR